MNQIFSAADFVALPFLWCGTLWALSQLSGWSRMARTYCTDKPPVGTAHRHCRIKVGVVGYGGGVTLCADASGLYMTVWLPFRFAHPPLFIPWSEFHHVNETRVMWIWPALSAKIGQPVAASIRLPLWVRQHMPIDEEKSHL